MVERQALDRGAILAAAGKAVTLDLQVLDETDSTNDAVWRLPANRRHGAAILANSQASGRGRRGRRWHSPPDANLYLSLGWGLERQASEWGTLPLVVGVAIADALQVLGLEGLGLKWPNDVQVLGRKLGGVLVETRVSNNGRAMAVIGIGLNINMGQEAGAAIDQDWTDLASQLGDVSRNLVAGQLLMSLEASLQRWQDDGFAPFRARWLGLDCLRGQMVRVSNESGETRGQAEGVGEQGGLVVRTDSDLVELLSGTVEK